MSGLDFRFRSLSLGEPSLSVSQRFRPSRLFGGPSVLRCLRRLRVFCRARVVSSTALRLRLV